MLEAADDGDAARLTSLVEAGASADARLSNGETSLMRAASRGFEDVARALLDAGADVNARRGDGFTPLLLAAFFGHESLVRLLLERGAETQARTRLGTTARQWADARGFACIAAMLPAAARPAENSTESKSERGQTEELARQPAEEFERARAEEVSIFSRKPERRGVLAAFERADPEGAEKFFSTPPAKELTLSESDSTSSSNVSTSSPSAATSPSSDSAQPERVSASEDSVAGASAASASVRHGEALPSHPSASTFRLRNFLRSWQASVGTALLLLAFGVGVFALWRDSKTAGQNQRPAPTPQSAAAQPVAPLQSLPAPQASPAVPEAQAGGTPAEMPGASYVVPVPAPQPFYNPPNSVLTNAPKEPTVISESGVPANADTSRTKNSTDSTPRETPSPTQTGRNDSSDNNARASDSERSARTNDAQPARPSSPPPAPTPTPRGKVIPWPPQ
jgi:hypothetical protein